MFRVVTDSIRIHLLGVASYKIEKFRSQIVNSETMKSVPSTS